jgi:hypothetical protein
MFQRVPNTYFRLEALDFQFRFLLTLLRAFCKHNNFDTIFNDKNRDCSKVSWTFFDRMRKSRRILRGMILSKEAHASCRLCWSWLHPPPSVSFGLETPTESLLRVHIVDIFSWFRNKRWARTILIFSNCMKMSTSFLNGQTKICKKDLCEPQICLHAKSKRLV